MTEGALTGARLRELFLTFFAGKGHAVIPSASLIPEHDPTVLFTTAGVQPLVPYLLGMPHPQGKRIVNVQKCLRTADIDAVGDSTHLTCFEMLGNWSLGDYFKEEAIAWSDEFLTSDRWLKIPRERISVTVFAGDADAPRDEETARLWRRIGLPRERIFAFGKQENWWGPAGQTGPCGPDTEMFYDTGKPRCVLPTCGPNCPCGKWVEIWNDVFMEYEQRADGSYGQLPQKNVDTGMGLERTVAFLNGRESVFDTDLFLPLVTHLREQVPAADTPTVRRIADHVRAAIFLLTDPHSVPPSNVEQGYVLRRLIRRSLRFLELAEASSATTLALLDRAPKILADMFGGAYPELASRAEKAKEQLHLEYARYQKVRGSARRIIDKLLTQGTRAVSGAEGFRIYQETGVHPDLLGSLGTEGGMTVDMAGFEEELLRHQEVSRAGSAERFAGGLADHSAQTTKLHTATHLLHESLRRVLGTHVEQKGSNITSQRLRFDFTHAQRMTPEDIRRVEELVNEQVRRDLPVTRAVMSPSEAKVLGALGFFEQKYGDRVNVYSIGDFSREICGGPHVERTGQLGSFRIVKEEAVSAGVRRIRAVVA